MQFFSRSPVHLLNYCKNALCWKAFFHLLHFTLKSVKDIRLENMKLHLSVLLPYFLTVRSEIQSSKSSTGQVLGCVACWQKHFRKFWHLLLQEQRKLASNINHFCTRLMTRINQWKQGKKIITLCLEYMQKRLKYYKSTIPLPIKDVSDPLAIWILAWS